MEGFYKHGDCPASELLLAFVNGEIPLADGDSFRQHLSVCEFCGAEAEFYRSFPPIAEEKAVIEEMPEPLLELAEALLQKDHDLTPLYRLIDNGN